MFLHTAQEAALIGVSLLLLLCNFACLFKDFFVENFLLIIRVCQCLLPLQLDILDFAPIQRFEMAAVQHIAEEGVSQGVEMEVKVGIRERVQVSAEHL